MPSKKRPAWFSLSLTPTELAKAAKMVGVCHTGMNKKEVYSAVCKSPRFEKLRKADVIPPTLVLTATVKHSGHPDVEVRTPLAKPLWKFLLDVAYQCHGEAPPVGEREYKEALTRVNTRARDPYDRSGVQMMRLTDEDGDAIDLNDCIGWMEFDGSGGYPVLCKCTTRLGDAGVRADKTYTAHRVW